MNYNMNEILLDFIKYLYNESNITRESFSKCVVKLEESQAIEDKEIYNFESQLVSELYDFKTEILDSLLINLSQFTDIEDIDKVYQKLETIQAILTMEIEEEE